MSIKSRKTRVKQKEPWSRSDKLSLIGVVIAIIGLIKELLS